ncbi:MAG TPA: ribonuclease D [Nevskiaceae bacterium]|nr:ribonuclease D [Nevskiaceae bacterium]
MQLIDTDAALRACLTRWRDAPVLALDTEFVRVDTYDPRLCLLQVGDGHDACVLDMLALHDLDALLDVLFDARRVKLLHAGSQDLEIFAHLRDAPLAPLFDTQIAAELLGDGDQLGYAALVEQRFGITLDKSLTRTDWARRPLTAAELDYAAEDVTHLYDLYPVLREALVACGRLAWLQEDCARLATPARYANDPQDAWRRLKGLQRLPSQARAAAVALAQWREATAQRANRPRRWILSDDALYALAGRQPHDVAALANVPGLPPKTAKRHGSAIVAALAAANGPLPEGLQLDSTPLTADEKRRFNGLRSTLESCAAHLGIPRGLLANRADLEQLTRHGSTADIALTHGWRHTVATDVLDAADLTAGAAQGN